MFGRGRRLGADIVNTIIGEQTQLRGDVHFSGDLVVLGAVHGNIVATVESGCVVSLSHSCRVEGEIRVPNVVIDGTVAGDVYSSERIQLSKNARINGNLYYSMIEMEMGAEVNGSLVHVNDSSDPKLTLLHEPESDFSTALLLDTRDSQANQARETKPDDK